MASIMLYGAERVNVFMRHPNVKAAFFDSIRQQKLNLYGLKQSKISQIVFDQLDLSYCEKHKLPLLRKKNIHLNAVAMATKLVAQCQSDISSVCYMHTHLVVLYTHSPNRPTISDNNIGQWLRFPPYPLPNVVL